MSALQIVRRGRARRLAALTTLIFVATSAVSFPQAWAHIHRSPNGAFVSWYPRECCHDGDCRPVSRIQIVSHGFLMTTEDGSTVFVTSQKMRRYSLDSRWHICLSPGEYPDVLCVFEPPGS
jgi:hypothetical protein